MGIVPDPLDKVPESDIELSKIVGAVQSPIYSSCATTSPKETFKGDRFIRAATVPDSDIKTYDPGYLVFDTVGVDTTAYLGDIYLYYKFHLKTSDISTTSWGAEWSGSGYDPLSGIGHSAVEYLPFTLETEVSGKAPGEVVLVPGEDPYPYSSNIVMNRVGMYQVTWTIRTTNATGIASGMELQVSGPGVKLPWMYQGTSARESSMWFAEVLSPGVEFSFHLTAGTVDTIDFNQVVILDASGIQATPLPLQKNMIPSQVQKLRRSISDAKAASSSSRPRPPSMSFRYLNRDFAKASTSSAAKPVSSSMPFTYRSKSDVCTITIPGRATEYTVKSPLCSHHRDDHIVFGKSCKMYSTALSGSTGSGTNEIFGLAPMSDD